MNLDTILKKYLIFVDTCSFMCDQAEVFFQGNFINQLENRGRKILVQYKVAEEINRLQESNKKETRDKAKKAGTLVNRLIRKQLIDPIGTEKDKFADHTFLKVFMDKVTEFNMCLITQDSKLANAILAIKNQQAVFGKDILVFRINEDSNLRDWEEIFKNREQKGRSGDNSFDRTEDNKDKAKRLANKLISAIDNGVKAKERYQLKSNITPDNNKLLGVLKVPELNDVVSSGKHGMLKLVEEIGDGGEGKIYVTDNGLICKIYYQEKLTENKKDKILLMLQSDISIKGICWPIDYVTYKNNFVGYLMHRATGKTLQTAMFVKPLLLKNFPYWTRKHLVELCLNILGKIYYLHSRNIIIGDINPNNILIKSEKEVYFVDTDSYQIEAYPCPVGTINYTAPEIQRKDFKTFLRTFEQEYFAVATLMFMLLHPGKPPYSHQGGGSPSENIRSMNFSYPLGEQSNKKAPDGPWRFIWSNLPYATKELFYNVFRNNKRVDTKTWIENMCYYLVLLQSDFASEELFPTEYKKVTTNTVEATCVICKKIVKENKHHIDKLKKLNKDYICPNCGSKLKNS
ncbi:hypothetical protein N4T77_02370 [Clostridium sp. CX1]|uniref:Protein kinase domain-containing protein n=1 Tax=Clostridium tanneri TaxID=3037988 RepID=A0ABU4JT51_9CLOT|nr:MULTISPECIES: hypothetical protein [unclassified Clostridium]MCT8975434.1 hypothetical protein [Clostridium sp. CX1]MDW8801335.1 hypothetical protein [Clostridium sp. A1-XYC3]